MVFLESYYYILLAYVQIYPFLTICSTVTKWPLNFLAFKYLQAKTTLSKDYVAVMLSSFKKLIHSEMEEWKIYTIYQEK